MGTRQSELPMTIKAAPYQHQREAFAFACALFGIQEGNTDNQVIKETGGDKTCQKKKPDQEA